MIHSISHVRDQLHILDNQLTLSTRRLCRACHMDCPWDQPRNCLCLSSSDVSAPRSIHSLWPPNGCRKIKWTRQPQKLRKIAIALTPRETSTFLPPQASPWNSHLLIRLQSTRSNLWSKRHLQHSWGGLACGNGESERETVETTLSARENPSACFNDGGAETGAGLRGGCWP